MGVPVSVGFVALANPGAVVIDEDAEPKTRPGGIDPVTVQDLGGLSVAGFAESAKATGAIAVPAVTAYGLGWPGVPVRSVKTVAPATESTAPREAAAATAAFSSIPALDSRTVSAARAKNWSEGKRWRTAINTAAGRRSRPVRAAPESRIRKSLMFRVPRNPDARSVRRGPWVVRAVEIEFIART